MKEITNNSRYRTFVNRNPETIEVATAPTIMGKVKYPDSVGVRPNTFCAK